MMAKELILSSYQSFDDKKNLLLLGEWCLSKKNFKKKKEFNFCKPYGLEEKQIKDDFFFCEKLFNFFIEQLTNELNEIHKINFSNKAWKIFLGPWLKRYIRLSYNRFKTLDAALSMHDINKLSIGNYMNYDFTTRDTDDLYTAAVLPEWDYFFLSRTLKYIDHKIENVEVLNLKQKHRFISDSYKSNRKKSLVNRSLQEISRYLSFLKKNDKVFIKNSYLGTVNQFILELQLKQIPVIWRDDPIFFPSKDLIVRKRIKIFAKENLKIYKMIRDNLPFDLPIYAVEGLSFVKKSLRDLNWPKKPKKIFTSNSFWGDEIFKYYVAENVDRGSEYIVGQHGHAYGTRFSHDYSVEYVTCDKFLTWGQKFHKKEIVGGNFCPGIKTSHFNSSGGLLIINRGRPIRSRTYDRLHLFIDYLEDIKNLVEGLSSQLQSKTLVRNRHLLTTEGINNTYYFSFLEKFPKIRIDNGAQSISNLIKNNKLSLFTFYSTGFLECLTKNIPTICFDKDFINFSKQEVKKDFEILIQKKIIFTNINELTDFLNKNWFEIINWWQSEEIQSTRENFIKKYSIQGNLEVIKKIANYLN